MRLILRRYTQREWLAEEPDLPFHEAASLRKAGEAGIPVPRLVAFDPHADRTDTPALLMTQLPGAVDLLPSDFDDWLTQQARILQPLHAVPLGEFPWRYAPYNNPASLEPPAWSDAPQLWEKAIEIVNSPPPITPEVFIHRDFHPVNVLWQDGKLSGLVDWPNACRGPAGIDISWCRANLAELYGVEAADRFLQICRSIGAASGYHPFWDLMVIIEILPGPPDVYPPWVEYGVQGLNPGLMLRREEAYLASVLARLGV